MGHDKEHSMDCTENHLGCEDCEDFDATAEQHGLMPKADKVKMDAIPKNNFAAEAAPTVDDDVDKGYSVGSSWADVINQKSYICLNAANRMAVWIETTQSGGGMFDPDPYEGVESVTYPNGLIMKMGTFARTAASTAMTFDEAFPNAVISIQVTNEAPAAAYYASIITAKAKTGFTVYCGSGGTQYHWIAIGW